jgi:ankyrin repeat protein
VSKLKINMQKFKVLLLRLVPSLLLAALVAGCGGNSSERARAKLEQLGPFTPSAFMHAIYAGDAPTVQLFLEAGMDVNRNMEPGYPIQAACGATNLTLIRMLLAKGANPNVALEDGSTPLMFSVATRNPEAIILLLSHGANINAKQVKGITALMIAAEDADLSVVKALLNFKPDLEVKALDGLTALDSARLKGHQGVVEALRAAGAVICTDYYMSRQQNSLEDFLPSGVAGAAARVLDNRGDDAASMEVIRTFYAGKVVADWNAQGMSPSQLAAMLLSSAVAVYKSTVTVKMFTRDAEWERDPRKGFVDKVRKESWDAFKRQLRIAAAADPKAVNIRDAHDNTALMWAAMLGDLELAKWLVEKGADLKAHDAGGTTALDVAKSGKQVEIVDLLSKAEGEKSSR